MAVWRHVLAGLIHVDFQHHLRRVLHLSDAFRLSVLETLSWPLKKCTHLFVDKPLGICVGSFFAVVHMRVNSHGTS